MSKKHHSGEKAIKTKLVKDCVREIYIESYLKAFIGETLETFHYDYFKLEDGELHYRGNIKPLTTKRVLKSVGMLVDILGKGGLHSLRFDKHIAKLTARQSLMLNKTQEELPPESDITKADDTEFQEIVENALRSIENLKQQVQEESTKDLPVQEPLGLDKQIRSIRGSLKVEVAKRFSWKNTLRKSTASSRNSEIILENMTMAFEKTSPSKLML